MAGSFPAFLILKTKKGELETMEKSKDTMKEFKLVFNAGITRRLIRMGIPVADIKQDRDNADKTVFVFKNDANFREAFENINKEIAEAREKAKDEQ